LWPLSAVTELPNCSICLEKLDATANGLLTILCNHSFHCECLSKWTEKNICPICRYTQLPWPESTTCSDCGIDEHLWMCLVCGYVGCSRYKNKHSEEHFLNTKHTYAMELDTQSVWDYTRDEYVHRVAANYPDNKLVEVPNFNWELELANTVKRKDLELGKEEALQLEWQYLLEAHLETQKRFFEERIAQIESVFQSKIKCLEKENTILLEQKSSSSKKLEEQEKHKKSLEKRINELNKKAKEIKEETMFLRDINRAAEKNQDLWQDKIKKYEEDLERVIRNDPTKDERISDLQRQADALRLRLDQINNHN